MSTLQPFVILNDTVVPINEATLSIASSAVLYGLSIYSVVFGKRNKKETLLFRLNDHLIRMRQSASMIGFDSIDKTLDTKKVKELLRLLDEKNNPKTDQFYRLAIHATDLAPGIKTRNLSLVLSIFSYDADSILPQTGARIKTSQWRRVADTAIPARAKVNGAYVNSALAKQDALDSGYDDCLFLNQNGYISELSAANIFLVKNQTLITPDTASDILEGITRRSIIDIAKEMSLPVVERKVALTELYTADEVFACGTSAFIAPITNIDNRIIANGKVGGITSTFRDTLLSIQSSTDHPWITVI